MKHSHPALDTWDEHWSAKLMCISFHSSFIPVYHHRVFCLGAKQSLQTSKTLRYCIQNNFDVSTVLAVAQSIHYRAHSRYRHVRIGDLSVVSFSEGGVWEEEIRWDRIRSMLEECKVTCCAPSLQLEAQHSPRLLLRTYLEGFLSCCLICWLIWSCDAHTDDRPFYTVLFVYFCTVPLDPFHSYQGLLS